MEVIKGNVFLEPMHTRHLWARHNLCGVLPYSKRQKGN